MKMDTRMGQIIFEFNEAGSSQAEDIVLAGARDAGYTLEQIGQMVGLTRERIRQRLKRVPADALKPEYAPSGAKQMRGEAAFIAKQKRRRQRRILGLKQSAQVMNVPVATLTEIQRLHTLVSECRGWTPLDHPSRLAIEPFGELLWKTMQDFEIPQLQMERVLGKGRTTFVVWLRNHGYLKQMPSQRSYKGVVLDRRARKPSGRTMVPGGVCKQGHLLTTDNIVSTGPKYITCKRCRSAKRRERYLRNKMQTLN